jgi:hypothetical protein
LCVFGARFPVIKVSSTDPHEGQSHSPFVRTNKTFFVKHDFVEYVPESLKSGQSPRQSQLKQSKKDSTQNTGWTRLSVNWNVLCVLWEGGASTRRHPHTNLIDPEASQTGYRATTIKPACCNRAIEHTCFPLMAKPVRKMCCNDAVIRTAAVRLAFEAADTGAQEESIATSLV